MWLSTYFIPLSRGDVRGGTEKQNRFLLTTVDSSSVRYSRNDAIRRKQMKFDRKPGRRKEKKMLQLALAHSKKYDWHAIIKKQPATINVQWVFLLFV